jgi:hypothetical protein
MYSFVFKTVQVLTVIFWYTFLLMNHRSFSDGSDRTVLTISHFRPVRIVQKLPLLRRQSQSRIILRSQSHRLDKMHIQLH